jgi:hypothetical protein
MPESSSNKWILHHDIVPSCTVLSVGEFLAKNKNVFIVLEHPVYPSDLAPFDFLVIPTANNHFETVKICRRWQNRNLQKNDLWKCFNWKQSTNFIYIYI